MRTTLLIIVILFYSSFAMAQGKTNFTPNSGERNLFCHITFGPTVDWFAPTTDLITREKAKMGLMAGISVDMKLAKQQWLFFSTGLKFRYLQGEISFENKYEGIISDILPLLTLYKGTAVRNYQTMYLTIPTGLTFRTPPSRGCVFVGKIGLYHNFKVGGDQFDSFILSNTPTKYFVTTDKEKNKDASLFAESGFMGLGFEYEFKNTTRVFANFDYSCQFNYFSSAARSNTTNERFKSMIHSLHIVFGFLF